MAAIAGLLLAGLVVFTLKRRRSAHATSSLRWGGGWAGLPGGLPGWSKSCASSRSDKQELLPEAEDQLSVESLSLPEEPKQNQA